MGSLPSNTFDIKKIAVIGAGPCGLAAVTYLKAQGSFEEIVVFEQQDEVGGVWYYSEQIPAPYPAPQLDPFLPPDVPLSGSGSRENGSSAPVFPSPMYEQLHANIPGVLMQYSDKKFPEGCWAFPKRETIQEYLVEYGKDVRGLVKFCFQVNKVTLVPKDGKDKWLLEARSTTTDETVQDTFDAVVMANGHYATPFIPDMKNLHQFQEAYPSSIIHSKLYRTPEPFRNKKVVVVGNGPSGVDIALQINRVCNQPALLSVRHETPPDRLAHTGCREVGEIVEFLVEEKGVRFRDGTVETGIDAVVFCTGFLFSYPFLPDLQRELITDGRNVHGLYQHLFSIEHPTLVFPGLNIKAIPWPLCESQAAVYSAIWSNKLSLPSVNEMRAWSNELEERKAKSEEPLHVFKPLEDGKYVNEMHDWVMKSKHVGKEPPWWNGEMFWMRKIFAEAKLRFEQQGCKATSLEELGLVYESEKEQDDRTGI
jgi:cation diffusion facilitator CzcD-associated flavoprotein CzcO